MDQNIDAVTHKLLRALMYSKRESWHGRMVMDIKPSEARVLMCVKRATSADCPDIKVSEISRMLQVTSPTVTQLLKSLESQELIERHLDPADRRSVGITLTKKGEEITDQAIKAFTTSIQNLVEFLGEEDSNQLAELLLKVSRYYNEKANDTTQTFWSTDTDL
jgi:DNA-binding MarR family transcriptional regulator